MPPPSRRPSQLGANAENEWAPRHGPHGARPSGKLHPNTLYLVHSDVPKAALSVIKYERNAKSL